MTLGSKWTKTLTFENVVVAAVELAVLLFCCYFVASLLLTNAVAAVELAVFCYHRNWHVPKISQDAARHELLKSFLSRKKFIKVYIPSKATMKRHVPKFSQDAAWRELLKFFFYFKQYIYHLQPQHELLKSSLLSWLSMAYILGRWLLRICNQARWAFRT